MENDDIIVLNDDDGNAVDFEFLDLILLSWKGVCNFAPHF